jgi:PAS domain S-box-containing protein
MRTTELASTDLGLNAVDFEIIAESIPHIVWVASPDGSTEYFNRQGIEYTGLEREANYGWDWVSLVHPDDADRAKRAWEHSTSTETPFELEYRIRRSDGQFRWHCFRGLPVRLADGEIIKWLGTATDVEDQKVLEESLQSAQRETAETLTLLETLQSASPVGFGFVDRELRLVRLNEALAAVNGSSIDEQIGRRVSEVVPKLWSQIEPIYRRVLDAGESVVNQEISGTTAGDPGHLHHWLASYYPVPLDDEIIGVGVVVADITERIHAEALRAAVMDNMAEGIYTLDADGCVTFANASAAEMLGWAEVELRGKPMHSVIHHQCADGTPKPEGECELLKVRSQGRSVRVTDDAFTRKDGTIFPVSYSASPLFDGSIVEGVVVVFNDTTDERADHERVQRELDSLSWVGRIREALDEDRFVLYSQSIVPFRDGEPSEELLLRMIGRGGEIVLPGSFIPVAERFGMMREIDRWVVRRAIRIAVTGHRVHANVSAQSISDFDLLPMIERELRETGADPALLVFEITETALMRDAHAGEIFAKGLAELGCGLSLDDFGTGFGSFTYLKTLALQSIKIDIEFVRDLANNTANQHIVQAIIQLGRDFGYDTIAEGIEDDETLALLREYGVDYGQGFALGKPAARRIPD